MSSFARRLRRSQPGRRVSVASLIAIFAISLFATVPVAAVPAVPGPGYRDFQYNPGPDTAPGGDAVTGSRNQSKIWFNDGRWFGMMFDKTNAANASYRIQTLNMSNQTWSTGGTATQADNRNKSHADVLSDGNTLWAASSLATAAGDLRVYKFTYNATTHKYAIVAGFPKIIAGGGTDAATIAKAPNGRLWVAYTKDDPDPALPAPPATTARLFVASSTSSAGTAWNAPIELPGGTSQITDNDLAAIVTINSGVGVFWSNQTVGDEKFYFQAHLDASADAAWQARETAYGGTAQADGHMSAKVDSTGQVIVAVKTKGTTTEPLIGVLRRATNGTWDPIHMVDDATGTPDPTRPILVLDEENSQADVFMVSQVDGGFITRRTAPLSTLDFGPPSAGTPFIQSSADPKISDPTSSKQAATVASGLIVLASDRTTTIRRYLHGCAGSACPVVPTAAFSGTPLTGESPLTVQFTDSSAGAPTSWAWNFGDGGTSTLQSPSHTYNPGTWTVSLTVSNSLGSDPEVKTGYVIVTTPASATYTAMNPVRVMDSRNGTGGVSGKFQNGIPRSFDVAGQMGIPANAVAITGNLTVNGQSKAGFAFLGPTATSTPTSSTLNFPVGDTRANAVTVALSDIGELAAVYKSSTAGATTHLFLDVTGYFVEDNAGKRYNAFAPIRVMDTRDGTGGLSGKFINGSPRTFQVTGGAIPATATAITGNLTVTGQTNGGFVFLGPTASASPTSSTLNFPVGDTRANSVTVALNGSGQLVAVYKSSKAGARTHVFLDVTGYFDSTGNEFIPLSPVRVMDTRYGTGGLSGKFVNGTPRNFDVAETGATVPGTAVAITGNLTVTGQSKAGFAFIGPTAAPNPTSSTLNFPVGDTRANAITVGLSGTGGLGAVYRSSTAGATTHLFVDVTGYFIP